MPRSGEIFIENLVLIQIPSNLQGRLQALHKWMKPQHGVKYKKTGCFQNSVHERDHRLYPGVYIILGYKKKESPLLFLQILQADSETDGTYFLRLMCVNSTHYSQQFLSSCIVILLPYGKENKGEERGEDRAEVSLHYFPYGMRERKAFLWKWSGGNKILSRQAADDSFHVL